MKNIAIIVCSGNGSRMNMQKPKQFINIYGKPIICYTLDIFQKCASIDEIIIVTNDKYIQFFKKNIMHKYTKIKKVIAGGLERMFSVYNGIKAVENTDCNVVIHDGVRPFVKDEHIAKTIDKVSVCGACILGVLAKDTVKICKGNTVSYTLERKNVWIIQTPQVFRYDIIKNAYEKAIKDGYMATDDASVVEYMGGKVVIVEGDYENIKITTKDDLKMFNKNTN